MPRVQLGEETYSYEYLQGDKVRELLRDDWCSLGLYAIDIETFGRKKYRGQQDAGLLAVKSEIRTLQFYSGKGAVIILDFLDPDTSKSLLREEQVVRDLSTFLHKRKLIAHNALFETQHLQNLFRKIGPVEPLNIFCTQNAFMMIIHATKRVPWVYHGGIAEVSRMVLGLEIPKEQQLSDWSKPELSDTQIEYCAKDAILPYLLLERLSVNLSDLGMTKLFKLITKAQEVIAEINVFGHAIDAEKHTRLTNEWKKKKDETERECFIYLNEGKGRVTHDQLKEILTNKITKRYQDKIWKKSVFSSGGRPFLTTFFDERDRFFEAAASLEAKYEPVVSKQLAAGGKVKDLPQELKSKLQYIKALKRFARNIKNYLVDPNSSKQISDWLRANVDVADWPISEKSGNLKTDAETFEDHDYIEVIKPLATYKKYAKLYSTYGFGWQKFLVKHDNRVAIHPNYNLGRTETGRMSSYQPNLQNPPRDEEFRSMFVARNGPYKLLSADFSQIELRVLAHLSQDPVMLKVYAEGGDLHSSTASLSGKSEKQVGKEEWKKIRQSAKSINFCEIFGGGAKTKQTYAKKAYKLIRPLEYFEEFQTTFRETYCVSVEWKQEQAAECEQTLKVVTPYGKVRRLDPDTYYTICLNTPVQGGACEIMMLSMVNIWNELQEKQLDAYFVNVIHDEVVIDCHEDHIKEVSKIIKRGMTKGMLTIFPDATTEGLVDVGVGKNWSEAKG